MKKVMLFVLTLLNILVIIGCIAPHTRLYKPITDREKYAFGKANREIYPNDVRINFADFDSARVAWPGIIKNISLEYAADTLKGKFLVEHHYYDWLEDFGMQQEKIFLSPRGEGLFQCDWFMKADTDTAKIMKSIGSMIIVYGIPAGVVDSIVNLYTYEIRVIEPGWFSTTIMDYGREGEPVKLLRIAR